MTPSSNSATLYPIGISIPITKGSMGYFAQTFDTVSAVKSNIINLLNTNLGERRFQPLFGSGLKNALFEQNLSDSTNVLQQIITSDIQNWIPNVSVSTVDINVSPNESGGYVIYISVRFTVNNIMDSVDLILQQNSI